MGEARAGGSEDRAANGRVRALLLALPVLVFAALAILFAIRLGSGDPSRLPSALIGRAVPTFELPPVEGLRGPDGQPLPGFASADLKAGRVTIVNVWASWCPPCRVEHPVLMDLARTGTARLVGLNYKNRPEEARRFLAAFGNPYAAVGADGDGRTAIDWGVYGAPETFIVGPDGTILHKHVGALTPEALPAFLDRVRAAERR